MTFGEAARMAAPSDNVAVAVRVLHPGTEIEFQSGVLPIRHTILEGHRFSVADLAPGDWLLSWGLPFGRAVRPVGPGDYLCNEKMLLELRHRRLDFALPSSPNFDDGTPPVNFDLTALKPGTQVGRREDPGTFMGYPRAGNRGVGTRNHIVVLGTSSRANSTVRELARRFENRLAEYPNVDGVVAVAHTEGGAHDEPNNLDLVLRTLAGFVTHPNVAAVLAVDHGNEPVRNALLRERLRDHGRDHDDLPLSFVSLAHGGVAHVLREGERRIEAWLPEVNAARRSAQPMRHLKIALQCGGSDAFSGISGNPVAGSAARELIRHGGSANLAETSELIGAEPYILANVRDRTTAESFIDRVARFQAMAGWHGHSAEGNPSGGNLYRGLYNIVIKSLGAALKKDPAVRLDHVIEYGEPMIGPGFYFMDSAGNDLESIAGQVASGCNLIFFITGNGSITNFPFVPTVKIVTTTARYDLLRDEMDFNAGRYLDGTSMDELGRDLFEMMNQVADGRRTAGERAGHYQVQLWRDWRQTDNRFLTRFETEDRQPTGLPISLGVAAADGAAAASEFDRKFAAYAGGAGGAAWDPVGLVLPTSLCSGQIAGLIVQQLNAATRRPADADVDVDAASDRIDVARYVTLPHTEGCGVSRGPSEELFLRIIAGYIRHPAVRKCLLLEHGCEKTHNAEIRYSLRDAGIDISRLGWASIQLDGGIEAVTRKVTEWFRGNGGEPINPNRAMKRQAGFGAGDLILGLVTEGDSAPVFLRACGLLAAAIVARGGSVVCGAEDPITRSPEFLEALGLDESAIRSRPASLACGQRIGTPGFHTMDTESRHSIEVISAMAAAGVSVFVEWSGSNAVQCHPFVPVIQCGTGSGSGFGQRRQSGPTGDKEAGLDSDFDLVVGPEDLDLSGGSDLSARIFDRIVDVFEGRYVPGQFAAGNVDFQVTRGRFGFSL